MSEEVQGAFGEGRFEAKVEQACEDRFEGTSVEEVDQEETGKAEEPVVEGVSKGQDWLEEDNIGDQVDQCDMNEKWWVGYML